MSTDRDLLIACYNAFNRRDIETALATIHPLVEWPNGMEGGYVHGHSALRDYWTRQWTMINPHVEPRSFTSDEDGRTIVDVHQVVRDLCGTIVAERTVQHVYRIEQGLVRHMEIREP